MALRFDTSSSLGRFVDTVRSSLRRPKTNKGQRRPLDSSISLSGRFDTVRASLRRRRPKRSLSVDKLVDRVRASYRRLKRGKEENVSEYKEWMESRFLFKYPEEIYSITGEIGSTADGDFYIGYSLKSEETVTIKIIAIPDKSSKKEACLEAERLFRLSHPNLKKVIDSFKYSCRPELWIVSEFSDCITLEELKMQDVQLYMREAAAILRGILQALAHLHKHGLVLNNVSMDNILLFKDGSVKIADITSCMEDGTVHSNYGYKPHCETDIWFFGRLMYSLYTHFLDFLEPEEELAWNDLVTQDQVPKLYLEEHLQPELRDIMHRCLKVDPRRRPRAEDLLKCPLFKYCASDEEIGEIVSRYIPLTYNGVLPKGGCFPKRRQNRAKLLASKNRVAEYQAERAAMDWSQYEWAAESIILTDSSSAGSSSDNSPDSTANDSFLHSSGWGFANYTMDFKNNTQSEDSFQTNNEAEQHDETCNVITKVSGDKEIYNDFCPKPNFRLMDC